MEKNKFFEFFILEISIFYMRTWITQTVVQPDFFILKKGSAILIRPPHRPPPLDFGPPPKKIVFFDVSDDLKQKKKKFSIKIFFGLRKFFNFFNFFFRMMGYM